jgi:hypothetical protein
MAEVRKSRQVTVATCLARQGAYQAIPDKQSGWSRFG